MTPEDVVCAASGRHRADNKKPVKTEVRIIDLVELLILESELNVAEWVSQVFKAAFKKISNYSQSPFETNFDVS
jgi:hypothetical protein